MYAPYRTEEKWDKVTGDDNKARHNYIRKCQEIAKYAYSFFCHPLKNLSKSLRERNLS